MVWDADAATSRRGGDLRRDPAGRQKIPAGRAITQKRVEGLNSVLPANLLAFQNPAGIIGDRNLPDAITQAADFSRNFRTEFESAAAEPKRFQNRAAKCLVRGGLVGDPRAKKEIGRQRQDFVGDPVSFAHSIDTLQKARAINHRGFGRQQRGQQRRVIARVVFQIAVLNQNVIAPGFGQPDSNRRSLSEVDRRMMHQNQRICLVLA